MAFVRRGDPTEITHVIRSYADGFTVKDADGNVLMRYRRGLGLNKIL